MLVENGHLNIIIKTKKNAKRKEWKDIGMKRLNTEKFIKRARLIHGDKYDYSYVAYVNYNSKIKIKCNKCKTIFQQTPDSHITQSHGCPKCKGGVLLNRESFVNKSNMLHNNIYDYSKFIYLNNKTKGIIICPIHGDFLQTPHEHLSRCGCPKCAGHKLTLIELIEIFNKNHNFKYDYSLVKHTNNKIKIKIICKEHGIFEQSIVSHKLSKGCPKCSPTFKLTTDTFIKKVKNIHGNKYDYSLVNYISSKEKIKIKCNKCKTIFEQRPNDHITGYGCPVCIGIISKSEIKFLDYLNIKNRQYSICPYNVDGYDDKTNTIYEFLGDYWHGNPNKYNPSDYNKISKKSYKQLYQETMDRLSALKLRGYTVKYIWESDWNNWIKNNKQGNIPILEYINT